MGLLSQVYSNKGTFQIYYSGVEGTDGQLLLLEISISRLAVFDEG